MKTFSVAAAGWLLATSTVVMAARVPLVQSVDIHVPVAPTPVSISGVPHLAYELHITNFLSDDLALARVEVRDDVASLAVLQGDALRDSFALVGRADERAGKLTITSGRRGVVYLWLPASRPPAVLHHRLEFERPGAAGKIELALEGIATRVNTGSPVVLDPPLRGGPWVALYDPAMDRGHRKVFYVIDGEARIPGRHAIDWIALGDDGSKASGDETSVDNWHGHGADVLAVADAVVTDARDDIPPPPAVGVREKLPLENHSGNYVILDIGAGRHVIYEHLQHGSVRVRAGDTVKSGQVIGSLGNTGSSSSGPHLHFHVADANAILAAEGLPFVFENFEVIGEYETIGDALSGTPWKTALVGGVRERELPHANSVVSFDASP